jgi:hypothetical protein
MDKVLLLLSLATAIIGTSWGSFGWGGNLCSHHPTPFALVAKVVPSKNSTAGVYESH